MWFFKMLINTVGNLLGAVFIIIVVVLVLTLVSGCATCPPGQNAYWATCIPEWDVYSPYYTGDIRDQTNLQEQAQQQRALGEELRKEK